MAFLHALTDSRTPSVRKQAFSSVILGALGWLTRGWSTVPMAARVSIPVKRLMERTFESLSHAAVSMIDPFKNAIEVD